MCIASGSMRCTKPTKHF
uniref:Uncharacterized protein n=1 Tax=Moniliophthora roreri TaxID=221103 RepID=A0A0W0EZI6_MONRR